MIATVAMVITHSNYSNLDLPQGPGYHAHCPEGRLDFECSQMPGCSELSGLEASPAEDTQTPQTLCGITLQSALACVALESLRPVCLGEFQSGSIKEY